MGSFALKPKGVIFDFDGVIVDSLRLHLCGWSHAYAKVFKKELEAKLLANLVGKSTRSIAKLLAANEYRLDKVAELITEKHDYIMREEVFAPLFYKVSDFMDVLTRKGVPFGIASHSPRAFIIKHLNFHKLRVFTIVGMEDCRAFKPSPEPFLLCARQLAIPFTEHSSVWVLEDSLPGIVAANRAGMISIGIASQHSVAELSAAGANVAHRSIADMMGIDWLEYG